MTFTEVTSKFRVLSLLHHCNKKLRMMANKLHQLWIMAGFHITQIRQTLKVLKKFTIIPITLLPTKFCLFCDLNKQSENQLKWNVWLLLNHWGSLTGNCFSSSLLYSQPLKYFLQSSKLVHGIIDTFFHSFFYT